VRGRTEGKAYWGGVKLIPTDGRLPRRRRGKKTGTQGSEKRRQKKGVGKRIDGRENPALQRKPSQKGKNYSFGLAIKHHRKRLPAPGRRQIPKRSAQDSTLPQIKRVRIERGAGKSTFGGLVGVNEWNKARCQRKKEHSGKTPIGKNSTTIPQKSLSPAAA